MTTIQVTVENLSPQGGAGIAQTWVGFHDCSFDTYYVGETASPGLETLAEDGIVGIEPEIPGLVDEAIANGAIPQNLPTPEQTIAGQFAASPAGINGGVKGMVFSDNRVPPFFLLQNPGETFTTTVEIDENSDDNRYFSYATMVFPTNDGFIANDEPIEIFDEEGNFIGAEFIVTGDDVLDAGTEVNDEDPANVLYTLDVIGNSVDENGTIQPYDSFLPAGSGGVLDFEFEGEAIFNNADFTTPDYQIARITVTEVEETSGGGGASSSPGFGTTEGDLFAVGSQGELVFTGDGDDLIDTSNSGGGNTIFAGNGNDTIVLGDRDLVKGGNGDDRFFHEAGFNNVVTGGDGADQFWIAVANSPEEALVIEDFELDSDIVGIAGIGAASIADLSFSAFENGTIVSFNGTDLGVFRGVDSASLQSSGNFVFA
ncbi:MAG: spondin domain-containing protein [Pleurocapsa sp.]